MIIPDDPRDCLLVVMQQAEIDLAAAHDEICKLQGVDPARYSWPEWSSPANTLRWFTAIRAKFGPERPRLGEWLREGEPPTTEDTNPQ